MKFDLEKLQSNYVETKAGASIDPDKLSSHIKEIYGQESKDGDSVDVRNQVNILCNKMEAIGLKPFGKLREKFKPDNNFNEEKQKMRAAIKETMEAIVYQAETGTLAPKDIAAQFGDLDFICKEGTLTNLQSILGEMTLGKQDISAFVTEAKNEMVTQLITEMYRDGKFSEYPYIFRKYEAMEIHNITSLKNTVANEYGLLAKTKDEDRYIKNISGKSKQKIQGALIERMTSPEAAETLIDRVAMNVLMNLPYYEEGMNKQNFVNNFMEKLEVLGIKGELANGAFIKYQEYVADGAKDNIQDIIKDAIIVKLHKDNAIESKDIDKVKLRLSLENSMDGMSSGNAIGEDVIKQAKENKLESYAFEYAIDKGLTLDEDDFTISDPAEYCIANDIKLQSQDPKNFILENIIDKYLKASSPEQKSKLEEKYQKIQNLGQDTAVELLGVNSEVGKMLDRKDASKIFAEFKQVTNEDINHQIDYKKCSLGLIEKMVDVTKEASKEKVRDYNKLSTKQKVGLAFSAIIPPVAIATYFLMKKSNRSKKEALENKLTVSIDKISGDLERVAPTTKKARTVDLAREIGQQLNSTKPKECSNSSQAINNNMSRNGSSRGR